MKWIDIKYKSVGAVSPLQEKKPIRTVVISQLNIQNLFVSLYSGIDNDDERV